MRTKGYRPYRGQGRGIKKNALEIICIAILAVWLIWLCFLYRPAQAASDIETPAVSESADAAATEAAAFITQQAEAKSPTLEDIIDGYKPDEADATMLARLTWGESRGIKSITEQAGVMWSALNRVDSEGYGMGISINHVVTFPDQFHGYRPWHTTFDDFGRDLVQLAEDVLKRWMAEKDGYTDVGRVLPKEYRWFSGNGKHNIFRDRYRSRDPECNFWNWSLPSPYES